MTLSIADDLGDGDFTFEMGEHTASFRGDRCYAKNHMWALPLEASIWRFGLTEYAVRLLQDVYFLDWVVEPESKLDHRMTIGAIESKKAESDLFSPIRGTLNSINESTLDDPSLINADPYGEGWLIEIDCGASRPSADGNGPPTDLPDGLLTPEQYAEHLTEAWVVAQRTIKGQANH